MSHILSIKPDFYWVGALDPKLRTFDIIMETKFGTSYNAYLLKGSEGVALFESVKDKFFESYLEKLQSIISLQDIKYIVVDHTEPDHAGSVAKLLEVAPHVTVVGSLLAIKYISSMINAPFKSLVVKEGDSISLGNKTIRFLSVPQLHWPDTMYSYVEEDRLLITCDSFGAHYCDERILRSELEAEKEADYLSAYKYYFNMIMGPFKPFVLNALCKIKDLSIDYICPGHGMILDQSNMQTYLDLYENWSQPIVHEKSIVIAYVSAYGYTKELAETLEKDILSAGYEGKVYLCNLENEAIDSVMDKISTAQGLLIGSPTILAEALPPIWQILSSLNPIMHKHITMGCFGSYGWSGEATIHIKERIKQLKCPMPLEPLRIVFKPSSEDLEAVKDFSSKFVEALQSK